MKYLKSKKNIVFRLVALFTLLLLLGESTSYIGRADVSQNLQSQSSIGFYGTYDEETSGPDPEPTPGPLPDTDSSSVSKEIQGNKMLPHTGVKAEYLTIPGVASLLLAFILLGAKRKKEKEVKE